MMIGEHHNGFEWEIRGTSASLGAVSTPGIPDQQPAHHAGCNGKEVRPVVDGDRVAAHEVQVRFMDKISGVEGVILSFPIQVVVCQPAEFIIHAGHERVERLLISLPPRDQ